MKSKKIKVELLLPVALVLLGLGLGGVLVRPSGEPDMRLENRLGDVVWNHDLHARMEKQPCSTCHHTWGKNDDGEDIGVKGGVTNPKPCKDCHVLKTSDQALITSGLFDGDTIEGVRQGQYGSPAMDAYHAKCIGCHNSVAQGPVDCRDCHSQRYAGRSGDVEWNHLVHSRRMVNLECVDCHHKDTEAKLDGDYRSCRECHPATLEIQELARQMGNTEFKVEASVPRHEGIMHGECAFCHSTENPADETTSCVECHQDLDPRMIEDPRLAASAPGLEQAVHHKCLECHNKNQRDLKPGMPAICGDCHKPSKSVLSGWGEGKVLWSHVRHNPAFNKKLNKDTGEWEKMWECETCHHTDTEGYPHLACSRCHGTDNFSFAENMPSLAKVYDKKCVECHKEHKAGPVRFGDFTVDEIPGAMASRPVDDGVVFWDHRFHADSMAFSCRECHHNTRTKDGALVICPTAVSCPEERGVGVTQKCSNCHDSSGLMGGIFAPGYEGPTLEEAFKRPCVECHQKLGIEPSEWEDFITR